MSKGDNKSFIDVIKNNKKLQYFLIVFISIVLVFVIVFSSSGKKQEESENLVAEYVKDLENKLSETLKEVDGVGEVSVVITVESGMETVLATKTTTTETANGNTVEEEPVIVNGKTVTLTEKYPKVSGVLIVAEGADNIGVLMQIQRATMSLLEIEAEQIEILTMKK